MSEDNNRIIEQSGTLGGNQAAGAAKKEIRDLVKNRRFGMEKSEVSGKSEKICRRLNDNPHVRQARQVLVYAAARNEVDLRLFVEQGWRMGKSVAFPRCEGENMEFYEVTDWPQLAEGHFHIMEPCNGTRPIVPMEHAVICVPGLAFSENGDRIGMGMGYYDRYLERYPHLYKIGLAYELQMQYSWTPDGCDIAMDLLITEQREVYIDESKRIM